MTTVVPTPWNRWKMPDVDGEVRVEVARRFIGDEDGRTRDHGTGNADALLFARRQFHGEAGFTA
jgi:hypothetical protein